MRRRGDDAAVAVLRRAGAIRGADPAGLEKFEETKAFARAAYMAAEARNTERALAQIPEQRLLQSLSATAASYGRFVEVRSSAHSRLRSRTKCVWRFVI